MRIRRSSIFHSKFRHLARNVRDPFFFFFQPFAKFVAKCGMIGIEFVTSPSMKNRAAVYAEEGKEYLGETMLT